MSGNKISDRPILPLKARKAVFEKLEDIADVASMSPEDRERYDNSVKVYRDYLVTMDAAEKERIKKGMKEGMKEGLKKGLEEGLAKGREEEKKEMARNMKSLNIPLDTISQITGLEIEKIRDLKI